MVKYKVKAKMSKQVNVHTSGVPSWLGQPETGAKSEYLLVYFFLRSCPMDVYCFAVGRPLSLAQRRMADHTLMTPRIALVREFSLVRRPISTLYRRIP